jgi:hypothetical protein
MLALRGDDMTKWMIGFVFVAVLAAISGIAFSLPGSVTIAVSSLVVAALLFAGALFERTASA